MLGFTPGFPYLGGMDPALETPRLKNPREVIPAGAVAIGGKQTGIYSIASPGGWRLIGRTPMRLFDPDRDPPIFLEAGMWIRFRPIEKAEFDEIEAASHKGSYRPVILEEGVSAPCAGMRLPGMLTTVQDGGRWGYQGKGMPVAGAMDLPSFRRGNVLVGNDENDGALEVTLLGPTLFVAEGEGMVAVTGADLGFQLNGRPAPMWTAVAVGAGDVLSFSGPLSGCRAYLCFSGGVDVPPVMESRSTYTRARVGVPGPCPEKRRPSPLRRAPAPVEKVRRARVPGGTSARLFA